MTVHECLKV